MSRITLSGNVSGTGTFTVSSPNSNTDRAITLPDAAGAVVLDSATQTLTNKTLTTPVLSSPVLSNAGLGSVVAGEFEYDGKVGYFTPVRRGLIPARQQFRLNSNRAGSNATGAQSVFGVGVTLDASTVYEFEAEIALTKSAGATSHTISALFGGTATINNLLWRAQGGAVATTATSIVNSGTGASTAYFTAATGGVLTGAIAAAAANAWLTIRGTISINAGGTFIPQYSLSAAPGGAYSTVAGSYFAIWPIGAAGADVNVGAWA